MRWVFLIILPYLSIFLETTLFSHFSLRGTVPDLVLMFVIFYSLLKGPEAGAKYGFLCGLFEDLYLGRFIGTNALAKGLTAYLIGRFSGNVFKENILVGFGGVFLGTLINGMVMFILGFIAYPDYAASNSLFINLSAQLVYNSLLSIPLYIWYYRAVRACAARSSSARR